MIKILQHNYINNTWLTLNNELTKHQLPVNLIKKNKLNFYTMFKNDCQKLSAWTQSPNEYNWQKTLNKFWLGNHLCVETGRHAIPKTPDTFCHSNEIMNYILYNTAIFMIVKDLISLKA